MLQPCRCFFLPVRVGKQTTKVVNLNFCTELARSQTASAAESVLKRQAIDRHACGKLHTRLFLDPKSSFRVQMKFMDFVPQLNASINQTGLSLLGIGAVMK